MKDYDLITCIAKRSGSEIWKAAEKKTDKIVALKFLRSGAQRFAFQDEIVPKMEFNALINLSHKNIASILDITRDEEDGAPFMVMEFVEGETLACLIRKKTHIPFSKWLDIMVQTADGLRHAYLNNIIHRDIKPSNIMLTPDGVVKIVDFGLARFLIPFSQQTFGADFGKARESVGTPAYMPPEQCLGIATDHRSDIYSLGAAFYHCLSGRPPFEGATDLEIMEKQKSAPLVPLYLTNPKAPQELSRAIEKTMEKDPNNRYQNYEEMIREFREIQLICLSREKGAAKSLTTDDANAQPYAHAKHGLDAFFSRHTPIVFGIGALLAISLILLIASPRTETKHRRKHRILYYVVNAAQKMESIIHALNTSAHDAPSSQKIPQNPQKDVETVFEKAATAIKLFQKNRGRLPSNIDQLLEEKLLKKTDILDPWGRPIRWLSQTRQIVSDGPDKTPDTDDDIKKPAL